MPRQPRSFAQDYPAHLRLRGIDGQAIFRCDEDRRRFLQSLRTACRAFGVSVHAYVLMTNHVHLLATQAADGGFAGAMQSVGRRYVAYFNGRYRRTGTLWEGRYRASLIGTEHYLFACYRYVEQNPVRAGLSQRASGYPWSSHGFNAEAIADPLVTPHDAYLALGSSGPARAVAYRQLFEETLDVETLQRFRTDANQGWVIGDEAFCREMAARLGRRTQRLPRGWPRGKSRRREADRDNESG